MNPARRTFLRQIMAAAWSIYRQRHIPGCTAKTFADALRNAWAWIKRQALPAPPAGPTIYIRSMVQGPIARSLIGKPYAGDRARTAGYVTSAMGR